MPTVRTVAYYRLSQGTPGEQVAAIMLAAGLPGMRDVEFQCPEIGPGFRLGHGFASVIWAQRIGRDCTIGHQCTLGGKGDDSRPWTESVPILGDRVLIWAGATIAGPVTIGDDAVIGAGAVVLHDVPAGAVVAGIPARMVSHQAIA